MDAIKMQDFPCKLIKAPVSYIVDDEERAIWRILFPLLYEEGWPQAGVVMSIL